MFLKTIAFITIVFSSFGTRADELKIYIWEDYLSTDVIKRFQQQTGHTVKQIFFENEMLRDEVIISGRADTFDLFIIDSYTLGIYAQRGLINEFSVPPFPNFNHMEDQAVKVCGSVGIPYSWGTIGIGYRETQVPNHLNSWMDILRGLKQPYKNLIIPNDDIDTVAVALLALGLNPMTNDTNELKQAYQLLNESKEHVISYRTGVGYALEKRSTSDMDIAVIYSGETFTIAQATGQDDWIYTIPKEGTLLWYECFASVSSKPFSDAALSFLNFINQPHIAAINAEAVWIATSNQSALKFTSQTYLDDKELFPDKEVIDKSTVYKAMNNEALKIRSRIMSVISQ